MSAGISHLGYHTNACRQRLEKAMLEGVLGNNRLKAAREREDAYLEEKVREGDRDPNRLQISRRNKTFVEEADKDDRLKQVPAETGARGSEEDTRATPMVTNDRQQDQGPIDWNDRLMENDFHDIVNADDEMYEAIDNVPMDQEGMADAIIGIIHNHVSEVWSPPRVNKLASEYGLRPGFSYDLQVNDENGQPWDFDVPAQRAKCARHVIEQKPDFLIGSPMCTAFGVLRA